MDICKPKYGAIFHKNRAKFKTAEISIFKGDIGKSLYYTNNIVIRKLE